MGSAPDRSGFVTLPSSGWPISPTQSSSAKSPEIQHLLALDEENAEIDLGQDEHQIAVRAVIDEALAQYVPAEWDAELVRLMETMDWTFDYADRPNSACYDQRREIERRLKALPLEVAISVPRCRRPYVELRLPAAPQPPGRDEGSRISRLTRK